MSGPDATCMVEEPLHGGTFALKPLHAGAPPLGPRALLLPGELVRVAGGPDTALEREVVIVQPSPARVAPSCVHFGRCGGCQYQHASYTEQLRLKQDIVEALLNHAGLTARPPARMHAGEPWGYRNRIRLRLAAAADGSLRAGYSERGSNVFLPVIMCPIAAPLLWRAVEALLQVAAGNGRLARWLRAISEVELFTDAAEAALQVTFLIGDPALCRQHPGGLAELCPQLKLAVPELAGAGAVAAPELSRRIRRAWTDESWGAPGLTYRVGGQTAAREHWVSRGSFFQVNRRLLEPLLDVVLAGLPGGDLAWDLFAGVGLFSQPLAELYGRVVAVEGADSAARDLAQGLAGLARAQRRPAGALEAVHASTLDFLTARQRDRERPELVVLDPPRAGLGVAAAALLGRIAPRQIVYVSCDPVTLVRDLVVVLAAGYTIRSLDLIDLFPQTFHVESVVHLELGP